MEQQKACLKCKHEGKYYSFKCTRKRKIIGKTLDAATGIYYDRYNIAEIDCLNRDDERQNRGIIASFFFGKTCGETAQFFESKYK